MKKVLSLIAFVLQVHSFVFAAPATITKHIKLDQFGYFPKSQKVAVIASSQSGFDFDAGDAYSPAPGANLQVRRWSDDAIVFTGPLVAWNSGATQTQSGDKGWWFDFSTVETAGSYYIYDAGKNVGSYRFEINNNVYDDVLKHAMRMFFYQRINFAKTVPYTDAKWADGACFEGSNQDKAARIYTTKDAASARDLRGGWMDAGDYNKYVTFAFRSVGSLLQTYRLHPAVFKDNYNIPESGNGIPDILDEVKWELDWLKRMQDATGTGGLLLKVGVLDYTLYSPPSTDVNPRYYVPECTSATLTGCALFAMASKVYKSLGTPAMTAYGDDLLVRAKNAWAEAKSKTTSSGVAFKVYETNCDNTTVLAGDADLSWDYSSGAMIQTEMLLTAAAYLYEATGNVEYKNVFESKYASSESPVQWWWGPYYTVGQRAMLHYAKLPGVSASVSSDILLKKSTNDNVLSINDYTAGTDLYRAYMPDAQYHSGSNETKGNAAIHIFDNVDFDINTDRHPKYKEAGESYLHWYHGVNPMGKVMLTNMYAYGGDNCVNEIYHSWFSDESPWDNTSSAKGGPAPGYVFNGPNKDFSVWFVTPPYGQPPQKAYKEWNTVWNNTHSTTENSWDVAESTIYTQAAYVGLIARVMAAHAGEVPLPLRFTNFTVSHAKTGARLNWAISEFENLQHFIVERSFDGRNFTALTQVPAGQANQLLYSYTDPTIKATDKTVYYRIKAVLPTNIVLSTIRKMTAQTRYTFQVLPNPATGFVWLNGGVDEECVLLVEIVDVAGVVRQKEQWTQARGEFSKYLSLETLQVGSYWIRLQTPQGVQVHKVVKQ